VCSLVYFSTSYFRNCVNRTTYIDQLPSAEVGVYYKFFASFRQQPLAWARWAVQNIQNFTACPTTRHPEHALPKSAYALPTLLFYLVSVPQQVCCVCGLSGGVPLGLNQVSWVVLELELGTFVLQTQLASRKYYPQTLAPSLRSWLFDW